MSDPHEGIDARNNPQARAQEQDQSPAVARGGMSGMTEVGGGPGSEQPSQQVEGGGTATGDPLAGVTIDLADREQAVDGDTGPEHPGTR